MQSLDRFPATDFVTRPEIHADRSIHVAQGSSEEGANAIRLASSQSRPMMTFFTSDHHFGHSNIIAFANRPYASVEQMNWDLVERHNAVVAPDDVVYVLGDVCLGKMDDSLAMISLLHGTKYLIPGNHDRMFDAVGEKYRNAAARYVDAGFTEVLDTVVTGTFSFGDATLSHFPPSGEGGDSDWFTEFRPPMPAHGLLLHGHMHGRYRKRGRCIDVGVDTNNGYPLSEAEIANLAELGDVDAVPIS